MPQAYKVIAFTRRDDGAFSTDAEFEETTCTAAMSRAGELSSHASGVAVVALFADGETETLARYGTTPADPDGR